MGVGLVVVVINNFRKLLRFEVTLRIDPTSLWHIPFGVLVDVKDTQLKHLVILFLLKQILVVNRDVAVIFNLVALYAMVQVGDVSHPYIWVILELVHAFLK